MFLPDKTTDAYASEVMATLTPADAGVVLLYPVPRELITARFVMLPDSDVVFLLALLRSTEPQNDAAVRRLLANNRELYEKARTAGGTHYPVGAIPLTPADWQAHYGARYPIFAATKRRHDPNQVLAPNQGIFDR